MPEQPASILEYLLSLSGDFSRLTDEEVSELTSRIQGQRRALSVGRKAKGISLEEMDELGEQDTRLEQLFQDVSHEQDVRKKTKRGVYIESLAKRDLSELDISEVFKAGELAQKYPAKKVNAGYQAEFDGYQIRYDMSAYLAAYFQKTEGKVPDDFFEKMEQITRDYAASAPTASAPFEDAQTALACAQIETVLSSPNFISDPRSLTILESLADMQQAVPLHFNAYVNFEGAKGYTLANGFKVESIASFERIVDSNRLWTGKGAETRRILFANVAEALEKLAIQYPSETLSARLKLLQSGIEHMEDPSHILYHLAHTFAAEEERQALSGLAKDKAPDSKIAKEVDKILKGTYKDTIWAI